VGIITAADRDGEADVSDAAEAIATMERLNRYAAEKLVSFNISACTDITGFGLIVHLLEMTAGYVSANIIYDNLPYLSRIKYYIDDGFTTGGGQRNRKFVGNRVDAGRLPAWIVELLFDPQTSGGLLIAVESGQADNLLTEIRTDDPQAAIIGSITKRGNDDVVFV